MTCKKITQFDNLKYCIVINYRLKIDYICWTPTSFDEKL